MIGVEEDLQTVTTPTSGHVIDTVGMDKLVYEVRWSLSGAPGALVFTPLGSNESGATPDTWLAGNVASGNLTIVGDEVHGALQASGKGLIVLTRMPRYVAIDTYFSGASGSITLRAFGC